MGARIKLPPDMPRAMRNLPRNTAGYPVPFFVERIDGVPDFRVTSARAMKRAVVESLCWLCGEPLHRVRAGMGTAPVGTFVAGPMCLINKNSAEPPCHDECAAWAVKACPFLVNPNKERRETHLPEDAGPMPGEAILRNPGVTALIQCSKWLPYAHDGGLLFRMTKITAVDWVCQGREATLREVFDSVESGLPALMEVAAQEGPEAQRALAVMTIGAIAFIGDPAPNLCPNITQVLEDAWAS